MAVAVPVLHEKTKEFPAFVAAPENLTGVSRGTVHWIYEAHVRVALNPGHLSLHSVASDKTWPDGDVAIADLHRSHSS